jgi:hypothetical protein
MAHQQDDAERQERKALGDGYDGGRCDGPRLESGEEI